MPQPKRHLSVFVPLGTDSTVSLSRPFALSHVNFAVFAT